MHGLYYVQLYRLYAFALGLGCTSMYGMNIRRAMLQTWLKCLKDALIINPLKRINGVVPSGWISNIRVGLMIKGLHKFL